jgi:hypothetical protein
VATFLEAVFFRETAAFLAFAASRRFNAHRLSVAAMMFFKPCSLDVTLRLRLLCPGYSSAPHFCPTLPLRFPHTPSGGGGEFPAVG